MIKLKIIKCNEESFDCECCGSCYPEGIKIEYNGEMIWESYSDGHMYHRQTESSILEAILSKWASDAIQSITSNYTEEKRIQWDKKYPGNGNGIARTIESWNECKKNEIDDVETCLELVRSSCENLPSDNIIAIEMIALWIESEIGDTVTVLLE